MFGVTRICCILMLTAVAWNAGSFISPAAEFRSHPPMRPLPQPSQRPLSDGTPHYVDVANGDDGNDGSLEKPWKTAAHALSRAAAGDTIYLRAGTYHEHLTIATRGTRDKPLTLRSYPGELAVLDGGLPEFQHTPQTTWEPVTDGAPHEFRSTKTYPDLGGSAGATNLLGQFGDSMVPLHGYRFITDLRSDNEYLSELKSGKTEQGNGVYCGPGLFYDLETQRIHVRLAHTTQPALGENNYRGETDPRRIPLIVAGRSAGPVLSLEDARFVRIQDLAIRGARDATVSVRNCRSIEFDGVTMYGGAAPLRVSNTHGFRLWNSACRGIAAPWTFRGHLKYRAIEARLFSASSWSPTGQDSRHFELAWSEFTDCVDGVFLGNVSDVRFHHNLLDNLSDDGIFLTANTAYDGTTPGGNVHIYQNLLSRCLTTFAFGVGHGRQKMTLTGRQTGSGVFIYRNVFDFRRPVHYQQPGPGQDEITTYGRIAGDHGGPLWEPMTYYHNTFLLHGPPFRNYYLGGIGGHLAGGSYRRAFNNLLIQELGQPGNVLPPVIPPGQPAPQTTATDKPKPTDPLVALLDGADTKPKKKSVADPVDAGIRAKLRAEVAAKEAPRAPLPIDFQADGNLHWSYSDAPEAGNMFKRFRNSPALEASRQLYAPGWVTHDLVAAPEFVAYHADWRKPVDLRLQPGSPAINAGVPIPRNWSDPLEDRDAAEPDIGALPLNVPVPHVGIGGRLTISGQDVAPDDRTVMLAPEKFLEGSNVARTIDDLKPAVIVQGYPSFDAPLLSFALRKAGLQCDSLERTWLPPKEYSQYSAVVIVGDLVRARIEPNKYSPEDLQHVQKYLRGGGTLLLMRGNHHVFRTAEGSRRLAEFTGSSQIRPDGYSILKPEHPWVKHLDPETPKDWVNVGHAQPLRADKGELIVGDADGLATLYRTQVGRGQLIYVGWVIANSLPNGRSKSTVEMEAAYEEQMRILQAIAGTVVEQAADAAQQSPPNKPLERLNSGLIDRNSRPLRFQVGTGQEETSGGRRESEDTAP